MPQAKTTLPAVPESTCQASPLVANTLQMQGTVQVEARSSMGTLDNKAPGYKGYGWTQLS